MKLEVPPETGFYGYRMAKFEADLREQKLNLLREAVSRTQPSRLFSDYRSAIETIWLDSFDVSPFRVTVSRLAEGIPFGMNYRGGVSDRDKVNGGVINFRLASDRRIFWVEPFINVTGDEDERNLWPVQQIGIKGSIGKIQYPDSTNGEWLYTPCGVNLGVGENREEVKTSIPEATIRIGLVVASDIPDVDQQGFIVHNRANDQGVYYPANDNFKGGYQGVYYPANDNFKGGYINYQPPSAINPETGEWLLEYVLLEYPPRSGPTYFDTLPQM